MAYIVETVYTNRRILMGAEEITRKMASTGSGISGAGAWQRLRIGVRGTVMANMVGSWTAGLVVGCFSSAGVGGGFMADRSEAYIGVAMGQTYPTQTLTTSNTGGNLYCQWTGPTVIRRTNLTQTNTALTNTSHFMSGNVSFRSGFIVDIAKNGTSGAWSVASMAASSSANALTDKSYIQFIQDVARSDGTAPSGYSTQMSGANYTNPTTPWTNRVLDSISVAWTNSEIQFELCDVIVCKIA